MIYYEHIYPTEINEQMLDAYLQKGWYRIQQMLITTDLIAKDDGFFAVFWLRYHLPQYNHQKKSRKLLQAIQPFTVSIEPLQITDELEELFSKYREQLDFDMSPTVKDYLQGGKESSVFQTQLLSIRDGDKLIAAGCYDEASDSLMGILNIYDPAYKKYSLGKVLLLLKLDEAKRLQKTHFYPGYMSLHTPKFDYKLFPAAEATEVYNRMLDKWQPYNSTNLQQLYDEMMADFLQKQGE
jgi:leucyl-tRNA---protein transferase